jgi:hypothetical protein
MKAIIVTWRVSGQTKGRDSIARVVLRKTEREKGLGSFSSRYALEL